MRPWRRLPCRVRSLRRRARSCRPAARSAGMRGGRGPRRAGMRRRASPRRMLRRNGAGPDVPASARRHSPCLFRGRFRDRTASGRGRTRRGATPGPARVLAPQPGRTPHPRVRHPAGPAGAPPRRRRTVRPAPPGSRSPARPEAAPSAAAPSMGRAMRRSRDTELLRWLWPSLHSLAAFRGGAPPIE